MGNVQKQGTCLNWEMFITGKLTCPYVYPPLFWTIQQKDYGYTLKECVAAVYYSNKGKSSSISEAYDYIVCRNVLIFLRNLSNPISQLKIQTCLYKTFLP
jgi:hypothetical protein